MSGDWQQFALCAEVDPELFFPAMGMPANQARRICGACEVREICLKEALDAVEDEHGIFGGKTVQERKAMRRAQGDAA